MITDITSSIIKIIIILPADRVCRAICPYPSLADLTADLLADLLADSLAGPPTELAINVPTPHMSQVRPNDPNPRLTPTGDEQSSVAHLRRAQHRAQRDYLLEEMQSDLQHFSSTIQRLQDHFRATPQTDIALTRTLESSQAVFTALETAHNHLLMLRNTLRNPSLPQTLSSFQSPPPSTPTPVRSSLSSSTGRSFYAGLATNGWQETAPPLPAETSPTEERAARYVALSPSNRSIPTGIRVYHSARRSHAADGDRVPSLVEPQQESEAQDNVLWYSVLPPPPPPPPPSDRPQSTLSPRFNLGRTRFPRTQLDPTTPQQAPSSVVQFTRQSQSSVSTISSTSSSSFSSSSASQTDTNDDTNTTNGGGDGGNVGNDDLTSVNRAANRLFQRLSNLHETTRRLRERRWSNLPERGLPEGQTFTTTDLDTFDPVAPARRPDVYANLLRRHMSSTAPPPNAGSDTGAEEENKENIEGELVLSHIVWGKGALTNTFLVHLQWHWMPMEIPSFLLLVCWYVIMDGRTWCL
jgi:hypothetical protein